MKASPFAVLPLLFLLLAHVLASPVAVPAADADDSGLAVRNHVELDVIVNVLYLNVLETDKVFNATCATKCSTVQVVSCPRVCKTMGSGARN